MDDLQIAPFVIKVFGDEASVAVRWPFLAAEEAGIIKEFFRELTFDGPLRHEC